MYANFYDNTYVPSKSDYEQHGGRGCVSFILAVAILGAAMYVFMKVPTVLWLGFVGLVIGFGMVYLSYSFCCGTPEQQGSADYCVEATMYGGSVVTCGFCC